MSIKYDIADLINNMIELEICGNKFYAYQARQSDNPLLVQLFEMLAAQEERHREVYEHLRDKIGHEVEVIDEDYHGYLKEIIDGKFNLDPHATESCSDPMEVLEMGMRLENDSIRFVDAFGKIVGQTYWETVEQIKQQEQNHLRMLVKMKTQLTSESQGGK